MDSAPSGLSAEDADLADELLVGFEQGVLWHGKIYKWHFQVVSLKGDWPFLRASMNLNCHDCAVVSSWLGEELQQMDLTREDGYKDIMEVLHWSCFASNRFWRTVYGRGIWLTREEAKAVVRDGVE
ncbi:Uncharacterized protein SCF082_LOCUS47141 [Durusdinium trenchii]|uniref:Uncharacterized protein n=1 Tax=Durusdinium trenchii TaxID=1381693 RepID=A0ABP0RJI7_9DINO